VTFYFMNTSVWCYANMIVFKKDDLSAGHWKPSKKNNKKTLIQVIEPFNSINNCQLALRVMFDN
jgi:hypothetical protein